MRILTVLVVDESPARLDVAKKQLAGHKVTVVDNYNDAQDLLSVEYCYEVVLVSPFVSISNHGQEIPGGIFLAILAADMGAKFVGLLNVSNHHDHPTLSFIDKLSFGDLLIGGSKVDFSFKPLGSSSEKWQRLLYHQKSQEISK